MQNSNFGGKAVKESDLLNYQRKSMVIDRNSTQAKEKEETSSILLYDSFIYSRWSLDINCYAEKLYSKNINRSVIHCALKTISMTQMHMQHIVQKFLHIHFMKITYFHTKSGFEKITNLIFFVWCIYRHIIGFFLIHCFV